MSATISLASAAAPRSPLAPGTWSINPCASSPTTSIPKTMPLDKISSYVSLVKCLCFLTAYGYFKYCHKFFNREFHDNDIVFVAWRLGFSPEEINLDTYQKDVYQDHKARI